MIRRAAAPELRTERLVLRGHGPEDFGDMVVLWSDPEVVRFIGGRPSTAEETWGRLMRYGGFWPLLGHGFWTIRDHEGRFVGEGGLLNARRDLDPPFGETPEMGWALTPAAQGKGYAREALAAVLTWAAGEGIGRTVCLIEPANTPSIRLAGKLGFTEYARTRYHGAEVVLFERG